MVIKYLVICVNENQDVCSVDSYNTVEEANLALAEDARKAYEEIEDHDLSSIEVSDGDAEVVDGEAVWRWSIYPLAVDW